MYLLEPTEWKVLSMIIRHVLGWQDKIASRTGAVSLSVLQNGFTTKSGARFYGTGLSRATIVRALSMLVAFRIVVIVGEPTLDGQRLKIPEDDSEIDYPELLKRYHNKREAGKKQTSKATKKAVEKRNSDEGGTSNVPVRPTYQDRYVQRTSASTSNVPNISNTKPHQNQEEFAEPIDYDGSADGLTQEMNADLENSKGFQKATQLSASLRLQGKEKGIGPKGKSSAKKEKVVPEPLPGVLDAICKLCYGTLDAWKVNGNPAQIRRCYNDIAPAGVVTLDTLATFEDWWKHYDWRGKQSQRPKPRDIPPLWATAIHDMQNQTAAEFVTQAINFETEGDGWKP